MQSSFVQIRVDTALKQEADALFRSLGLDMSSAIRLFLTQSLLKGAIPFKIVAKNDDEDVPRPKKSKVSKNLKKTKR